MAIDTYTVLEIVSKTRRLLGVTDASKGGPDDTTMKLEIPAALRRFATRAKALQTVLKLSTKAGDKYLPLVDELLWPIAVSFVDAGGLAFPLNPVDRAPRPGSLGGRPDVWWLTAVNVPDETGPSVRTIGIDPYVNVNGNGNVLVEAIQLPQDISADTDVPEIHPALQPYIPYFMACELVTLFPEKVGFLNYWESRCSEGVDIWQDLSRPTARHAKTGKDVMGYRARSRNRL